MMVQTPDPMAIPPFLIRTREQQKAINEHNRKHPVPPLATLLQKAMHVDQPEDNEATRLRREEALAKEAETKEVNKRRAAASKINKAMERDGIFKEQLPGTHWDAMLGRYVADNMITRAQYERMCREAPYFGPNHLAYCQDKYAHLFGPAAKPGKVPPTTQPRKAAKSTAPVPPTAGLPPVPTKGKATVKVPARKRPTKDADPTCPAPVQMAPVAATGASLTGTKPTTKTRSGASAPVAAPTGLKGKSLELAQWLMANPGKTIHEYAVHFGWEPIRAHARLVPLGAAGWTVKRDGKGVTAKITVEPPK